MLYKLYGVDYHLDKKYSTTCKRIKSMEVCEDNHTFFCKQQEGESPELAVKLLGDNKIISFLLLYFIKSIVLYR